MVREWTSFFVAVFCLIYIYELSLAATSRSTYLSLLRNPFLVFFNIIALAFTLYHAATWFYLIGKVQPMKAGMYTTKPWQALLVNSILLLVIFYVVILLFSLK